MSDRSAGKPYWLDQGEQACEICGHAIIVQAEIRCTGCDAGVCEHCAVTVHETHEFFCVPCSALEEAG